MTRASSQPVEAPSSRDDWRSQWSPEHPGSSALGQRCSGRAISASRRPSVASARSSTWIPTQFRQYLVPRGSLIGTFGVYGLLTEAPNETVSA